MKRRNFLEHVGWTGAGIVWTLGATGTLSAAGAQENGGFSFVQISDSHIGFARPENPDVAGTLARAVAAINALPNQPAFVVHTGDITHLAKAEQFDAARSLLQSLKAPLVALPGEHDAIGSLKGYFASFGRKDAPDGWFSFDQNGIHFVSLVNVFDFELMGKLGRAQLDWLKGDLAAVPASRPVVVFAHVPLYALYPAWGWTTEDGAEALQMLARFDHVTVLN
ncbi:MAG: metallophosphoesterase, partial [Candidatus Eremiobacteraeota bacterium]|nr:metallophosphoesterase [Candidatus Eremiobacteraeota bacterium]